MASLSSRSEKIEGSPYDLSVVATSRNDNHGKNLNYRMQHFISGFVAQCEKHQLKAELILVEWNPPIDRPFLAHTLDFPKNSPYCSIRIIQVPKAQHDSLKNSDKIPLYQMLGKNVGIRRARGKFIMATNIDILFSDSIIKYMKTHLKQNRLYRADRYDVPEMLPESDSYSNTLFFCKKNYFRVNNRNGSFDVRTNLDISFYKKIIEKAFHLFYAILNTSILKFFTRLPLLTRFAKKTLKRIYCVVFPNNRIFLHTNACGDFTLMSKKNWFDLRGYPEWPIFSWHLDSVLLHQARNHHLTFKNLSKNYHIYHIEHDTGYTPEGARSLFARLDKNEIPYLSDKMAKETFTNLRKSKDPITYNEESWGLGNEELVEFGF